MEVISKVNVPSTPRFNKGKDQAIPDELFSFLDPSYMPLS